MRRCLGRQVILPYLEKNPDRFDNQRIPESETPFLVRIQRVNIVEEDNRKRVFSVGEEELVMLQMTTKSGTQKNPCFLNEKSHPIEEFFN